jgi:DNA-binding Xre family transcriptional regulator
MEDLGIKKRVKKIRNDGGVRMRFSYNRLWKLLIDKNINKQKLKELSGISSASVAKLRKGQNVTTNVLLNICNALDCNVEDIMEFVKDEDPEE